MTRRLVLWLMFAVASIPFVAILLFLVSGYVVTFDDDPLAPDRARADTVSDNPPTGAVSAFLPGRQVGGAPFVVSIVLSYDGEGHVSRAEISHADGVQVELVLDTPPPESTRTPIPTVTPAPTLTPVLQPSNTPIPTNTPRPTFTPTPQATVAFPTPTPESTALPTIAATNVPKPTPTPQSNGCLLKVTATTLNIRSGPSTGYPVVGSTTKDSILAPSNLENGWYEIYDGWVSAAWVVPIAGDCTFSPAAWLIHTIPNHNRMELEASYGVLAAAGIQFGVKTYADTTGCINAINYGGICIYRIKIFGSDCPLMGLAGSEMSVDPRASARAWMKEYERLVSNALWPYKDTNRLLIEICNECNFGGDGNVGPVYWWAAFLDEAITYAVDHQWPRLVMPTFGPGDGDVPFVLSVWKPALLKLQAANGLYGAHDYTPWHNDGLAICDQWLGCRHRRIIAALRAAGLDTLQVSVSEAARDWGCSAVSEDDFIAWGKQVLRDDGLHSVALWVGGLWGQCASTNLDGHYISLASKIGAALQ